MSTSIPTPTPPTLAVASQLRRGRRLEVLTLGWNVIEAVVSIWAGVLAGSTALIGFGLDAVVESLSGAALLWRLQDDAPGSERELSALRIVGVSFLVLAAWVGFEAVTSLLEREAPLASPTGIAIATLSLIVMPWLAHQKRKVARAIGSRALESDSRQTSLCAYLSAILLGGLLLHALFGWWWADSLAALVMVPIIVNEGVEALRGERCDCD